MRICKLIAASLLWRENRSEYFQLVSEILSNLQLISIIRYGFSFSSFPSIGENIIEAVQQIIQFFSAMSMKGLSSNEISNIIVVSILTVYFCLALHIFGLICYNSYTKLKISPFVHSLWTYCAQLHHGIFFWTINIFLMSTLDQNFLKTNEPNMFLLILGVLLIILNYLFGIAGAMFCYDPFLSNNSFASYSSSFQASAFIYKALLSPLIIFYEGPVIGKWIFQVVTIIFTLWRQEVLFIHMPYYDFSTFKLILLMTGSGSAVAITTLVAEYDPLNGFDKIYIQLIALALSFKLNTVRLNNFIQKYSLSEKQVNNPKIIFKKIMAINGLTQKINISLDVESNKVCDHHLLLLIGKMTPHIKNGCPNEFCFCNYVCQNDKLKRNESNYFGAHKVNNKVKVNLYVKMLERGIKSFQKNSKFKILLAYILLKEQGKFSAALLTLFTLKKDQLTFHEELLALSLVQKLEEEIDIFFHGSEKESENRMKSNIKEIVDFEEDSDMFFTLIKKSTQAYLQLWDSYIQPNASLYDFFCQSIKVEKGAEEIETLWEKRFTNQKLLSLCTFMYATYLSAIRNLPSKSQKIMTRFQIQQRITENMLGKIRLEKIGDMIFYVSMARERLGRILFVSRNVLRELGWSQADLINQNIKMIQPSFIQDKHDQLLINHLDKPKNQPDQSIVNSFVRKKEGCSIPAQIQVTIFPYVRSEPIYASIIQQRYLVEEEFLIIGPKGVVESFSYEIGKTFSLSIEKKANIHEICPDYDLIGLEKEFFSTRGIELSSERFQDSKHFFLTFYVHKRKKKTYKTQVKNIVILNQCYVCLYLTEKQTLKKQKPIPLLQPSFREEALNSPTKKTQISTRSNDVYRISEASLILQQMSPTITRGKRKSTRFPNIQLSQVLETEKLKITEEAIKSNNLEIPNSRPRSNSENSLQNDKDSTIRENIESNSKAGETVSSNGIIKFDEKLEQAIYVVSKEKYTKILTYLIIFYGLLCFGLMVFHVTDNSCTFNSMLQKIELITTFHRTISTIVDSDTNIRQMDLYSRRYISDQRQSKKMNSNEIVSNLILFSRDYLLNNLVDLRQQVHDLLETLNFLNTDLQHAIYNDLIVLKRSDLVIPDYQANGLQAINELANAINTAAHLNYTNFSSNQSDVKFVLNNALNGPLLVIERIVEALVLDCRQDLSHIKTKTIVLLPVVICGGIFVLILLLVNVKNYIKKRNQFIEILSKIDKTILQHHLKIVDRFYYSLKNDIFDLDTYLETKKFLVEIYETIEPKIKRNQKFIKSTKKLNFTMIKGVISTTIAILGFASAFFVLYIAIDLKIDIFYKK